MSSRPPIRPPVSSSRSRRAPARARRGTGAQAFAVRWRLVLGLSVALSGIAATQLWPSPTDRPTDVAVAVADDEQRAQGGDRGEDGGTGGHTDGQTGAGQPAPTPGGGRPVTIAFGGDINTVGGAGPAVQAGLPGIRDVLGRADLTVVNVETAITERGVPAAKKFVFRAPASTLTSLKQAGVDVVTLANNHGLDYGQVGLQDTFAAAQSARLPLVGLGLDEDRAYAPHVATVRGQRIAVLGATQVLDGSLADTWTAGPGKPGMASAKRTERMVQAVRQASEVADTVVVYLHWGRERDPCPLPTQPVLARALAAAGADVIVGAHAHVLLGGGYLDGAYVDYGLGNFAFVARNVEGSRTGVLTVTVQHGSVTQAEWTPAEIRSGSPHQLSGDAARRALADKESRRACTGLSARP